MQPPDSVQQTIETPGIKLTLAADGAIASLSFLEEEDWIEIPFRSDEFRGPAWYVDQNGTQQGINLQSDSKQPGSFAGKLDDLRFHLFYKLAKGGLIIQVNLHNTGSTVFAPTRCGLRMGLDTYMVRAPDWDQLYFPTLLRCEKTHFWGYAMSPLGRILGIASPDALASWSMNYNFSGTGAERNEGHRIYTFNLDLLNALPLPERHPQNLSELLPGESKTWTFCILPLDSPEEVKPMLNRLCAAPMIDCERYTLTPGETTRVHVVYPAKVGKPTLTVTRPNGTSTRLTVSASGEGWQDFIFDAGKALGVYTLVASNPVGKQSEAKVFIRQPWSWYLKQARAEALNKPQKASTHVETWMGFFSAFLARKHFPDSTLDAQAEAEFRTILPLMYDIEKAEPIIEPGRIQNTAAMLGLLTDLYESGGKLADLDLAARLADWLIQCQDASGAYRASYGAGVHYTSVTYLAKYMLELAQAEKQLASRPAADPLWQERYERHYRSAQAAVDDLENLRDRIGTEGEHTFEDGMISCTAAQLGMFALLQTDPPLRQKYTAAALQVLKKHACLEQNLVPDCRMHGGSLRFWEAQYDVLIKHNMFNSPHGWTSWKTYATWYLYLLTGAEDLLRQTMDTLGACLQSIDLASGELRWSFICDPYIPTRVFLPDPAVSGQGQYQDAVLGEQYIDMLSGWWKTLPGVATGGYWDPGGCCDNDVHEHFKCLEEVALTSAYVIERDSGELMCWNCTVQRQDGAHLVTPLEEVVSAVHFNLKKAGKVTVNFPEKPISYDHPERSLFWVSPDPLPFPPLTKGLRDKFWRR